MIVYYDVLLIDSESLLNQRQSQRFKRLEQLVRTEKGKAELVQRQMISLSRSNGVAQLREAFARCIVARDEGLVLKPDEPYFDFSHEPKKPACVVKLKKAYFKGWGDVGDLAVIGASFDAAAARAHKIPNLRWTHFFLGCLQNREHILALGEQPQFMVTNVVELPGSLLQTVATHCFPDPVKFELSSAFKLDFSAIGNVQKPADIFEQPLVFDMMCFSFDKESNSRVWSMRFPAVSKIQYDRKYLDAMTFAEFQRAVRLATEAPDPEDSQEMQHWIKALEQTGPLEYPADASSQECFSTQASLTSMLSTPSPKRRRKGGGIVPSPLPTITEDTTAGSTDLNGSIIEGGAMSPSKLSSPDVLQLQPQLQLHQKRVADSPLQASNTGKRRRPLGPVNSNAPLTPGKPGLELVPATLRPLVLTPANPEPPLPKEHQTRGGLDPTCRLHAGSFCTADEMISPPPCSEDAPQPTASGCSLRPSGCALPNCAILLAPCIASYRWLTVNLLPTHGVVDFAVEPEMWAQKLAMLRKRPRRKICLVEGQRQEATNTFLERITKADIRTASGAHEWTEVYDWRLLEDLTARESGTKRRGVDPWYKWRLGLV